MHPRQNKQVNFMKRIKPKLTLINQQVNSIHCTDSKISTIQQIDVPIKISKEQLKDFWVIGMSKKQIFTVVYPQKNLIGFVDQHAIHQRIRYEYFVAVLEKRTIHHVFQTKFMEKKTTEQDIEVLGQKYDTLLFIKSKQNWMKRYKKIEKWGITLIIQNKGVYLVSYHQILNKKLSNQLLCSVCLEILDNLEQEHPRIPKYIDSILAETACKAAIKFNSEISRQWCQQMMYNIVLCDFPWSCVHGRPTFHFKELRQLPQYGQTLDLYSLSLI